MAVQEKLYTAAEFWEITRLPENADKRLELIDGEIHEMPPSSPKNSMIAGNSVRLIGNFVIPRDLGYVFGADGGFTLSVANVRVPDASFYSRARAPQLPNELHGGPDLAIEVISPSESPRKINDKIALYLSAGTRLVWAVYPDDKVVEVWRPAPDGRMEVQKFDMDGTLSGEDVLPGFELAVRDLFQGIE